MFEHKYAVFTFSLLAFPLMSCSCYLLVTKTIYHVEYVFIHMYRIAMLQQNCSWSYINIGAVNKRTITPLQCLMCDPCVSKLFTGVLGLTAVNHTAPLKLKLRAVLICPFSYKSSNIAFNKCKCKQKEPCSQRYLIVSLYTIFTDNWLVRLEKPNSRLLISIVISYKHSDFQKDCRTFIQVKTCRCWMVSCFF